jgi:type IX secretion system PorP/SprF family membrane protein
MWTSAVEPMNGTRTMRHERKLLTALAIALLGQVAVAQQEVMVSQYMFNGLFLNPAYAGSHNYTSASLLHRAQWVQMEGAPRTSMLGIDGPVMGERMALGFTLVHDQIGVSRDLELAGHYAYRIRVGENSRLAFGLKAGMSIYSARLGDLTYWDANDQVFQAAIKNQLVGKFGFGMYWSNATSFIGLSVPTIYAADDRISTTTAGGQDHYFVQHYYLNAGHVFDLNEHFDIKPSVLVKYQPQAPVQADVNCNVLYNQRLWLGLGYRTGDAVVTMLEYQVNTKLRIGYAYDMTTSSLSGYTGGSHEVMLGLDLGKDLVKIKTPRYF